MKPITKTVIIAALAITVGGNIEAGVANAGTLENLERERAFLVKTFLDPNLAAEDRLVKIESGKPRLIDLERMVLRDDSLTARNTPVVRKAFANYDLTFLVHASAERNRGVVDVWLEQIGITTESLMSAVKVGG
ncbi:MAG: hypothetical protein CMM47_05920 [Rhodospirillaceae bacterium]|nr:hypothetical protein [Rhodospirillaceae bacterium]